ncbi:MAG: acyltransferase [Bacteroidales bacterium]|nr:acyltransferase [Bacteroidales bacterium]
MKRHIKNLDTFRAIAAIVVMIGHIELFRLQKFGSEFFYFMPSGHTAVMLFFVISGFLITYLLTQEKERYGQISLKAFYLRRIFRIWPVYYLVLLISAFFIDSLSWSNVLYAVTILPNVSHSIGCGWSGSPQIWSIGVENLFYIFFPFVIMFIREERIPMLLILFIVCYALLPHFIAFINIRTWQNETLEMINNSFFYNNKFDSLAIGCLIGYLYAKNHTWLKYLYNRYVFFVCLFVSIVCWFGNIETKHFNDEFMSVLFAVVILNVCTNNNLKINIENSVTKFLGKISYGIYMYHWIVLLFTFKYLPIKNDILSTTLLYIFVLLTTILIAWLSYNTFEKYFLNIKKQFER